MQSLSDETISYNQIEMLIEHIENRDKEKIMAMFSKHALSLALNFDESIEYLFSTYEGNAQIIEIDGGIIVSESKEYGKVNKDVKSWYNIKTSENDYSFFFIDCIKDTTNSDNIGLYSLRVVKSEDKEKYFTYWQNMVVPGIYYPKYE